MTPLEAFEPHLQPLTPHHVCSTYYLFIFVFSLPFTLPNTMSFYRRNTRLDESWIDVDQNQSQTNSTIATHDHKPNSPFLDIDQEEPEEQESLVLAAPSFYQSPEEDFVDDEDINDNDNEEDDEDSNYGYPSSTGSRNSQNTTADLDLGKSLNTLITAKTSSTSTKSPPRKEPEELKLITDYTKPHKKRNTQSPPSPNSTFELTTAWAAAGISLVAGISFGAGYAFGRRSGALRVA